MTGTFIPVEPRSLPAHHYLLLDLKVELMNDLAAAKSSLADTERALELLAERMGVLGAVDGRESRTMGFLHFKAGDPFRSIDLGLGSSRLSGIENWLFFLFSARDSQMLSQF